MGSTSGKPARSWRCCARSPPMAALWCSPSISWRMLNASPIACYSSSTESCADPDRSPNCAPRSETPPRTWRRFFLRSPEVAGSKRVPILPLIQKELREVLGGRALWTMLLLMCPLVDYSYFQALSLYDDASVAGQQSAQLATSL